MRLIFFYSHVNRGFNAHSEQLIAESSRQPSLRSTDKLRSRTKFCELCFSHAGPAAWNSLPDSIKLITDTNRFNTLKNSSIHLSF